MIVGVPDPGGFLARGPDRAPNGDQAGRAHRSRGPRFPGPPVSRRDLHVLAVQPAEPLALPQALARRRVAAEP